MFHSSPAAGDRARQTIHAAELLHDNASTIAYVCGEADDHEVVVAVVGTDLHLGGIWRVPLAELHEKVPSLENGGWSLVASPGTSREEIETRALSMARLAFRRWEAMRRWMSRHR